MIISTSLLPLVMLASAQAEPAPSAGAPPAAEDALYCLRVEAATGTRLENVQCYTRAQWAEYEVDVDKDWAEEGVRVIDPAA